MSILIQNTFGHLVVTIVAIYKHIANVRVITLQKCTAKLGKTEKRMEFHPSRGMLNFKSNSKIMINCFELN